MDKTVNPKALHFYFYLTLLGGRLNQHNDHISVVLSQPRTWHWWKVCKKNKKLLQQKLTARWHHSTSAKPSKQPIRFRSGLTFTWHTSFIWIAAVLHGAQTFPLTAKLQRGTSSWMCFICRVSEITASSSSYQERNGGLISEEALLDFCHRILKNSGLKLKNLPLIYSDRMFSIQSLTRQGFDLNIVCNIIWNIQGQLKCVNKISSETVS